MSIRYVPPHLRGSTGTSTAISNGTKSIKSKNTARRRLARDLVELERSNIPSITAHPIDTDILEWHVNIKPTDGVYCGIYLHLIMTFPDSYPSDPPTVKICTPISHPNIFDSFLCLSMLRAHTGNVPYEGWSSAYSVTSILMQLQSFLFADKIDQDGGYQLNAQSSHHEVQSSIQICKTFECHKCKHSHSTPWPQVKKPSKALIKIYPIDPTQSNLVRINGASVQTTHTYWTGAKGGFGCNNGKIFYEAHIHWLGGEWRMMLKHSTRDRGGLCRLGFGSEYASICGCDKESFGYGGTAKFCYNKHFNSFGECFAANDTITVAVDFDTSRVYFAKNGRIMEPKREVHIPHYLRDKPLFPLLAFKKASVEFNFNAAQRPCKYLMENGFKPFKEVIMEQQDNNSNVDWFSQYIIPELWVNIFEGLLFEEIFSAQFVCKHWYELIHKYNVMETNEIYCYYSKTKLDEGRFGKILGIGLSIRGSNTGGLGIAIHSQMDILSLDAWNTGCRTGVWGEQLTHFLPLVMNRKHAEIADTAIKSHLEPLTLMFGTVRRSNANELERCINRSNCLKLVDTLVTMMNLIVSQFVKGHENDDHTVSMVMCEKVVLGYCALHHLLLYLISQNKQTITCFANKVVSVFINKGSNQKTTRDLGKFLVYLMISTQYDWNDIAQQFIEESLTRNVLWMVQDPKYSKYDTTNIVEWRLEDTFIASKIWRRLIMFQVWFMKNNRCETLQGYNYRLGRPRIKVRKSIFHKTKCILNSKSWSDCFNELEIIIEDDKAIDQLLRFAVYNSELKGYHRHYNTSGSMQVIDAPKIRVKHCKIGDIDKNVDSDGVNNTHMSNSMNEKSMSKCWRNNNQLQIRPNNAQQQPLVIQNNSNGKAQHQQSMSKSQRRKLRRKNINKANNERPKPSDRKNYNGSNVRPYSMRKSTQPQQRRMHQTWFSDVRPRPQT